jgi:hypothetical protein
MKKLTEQDFVFNGRKNWRTFFKKQYLKENLQIEELKKEYSAEQIASKHNVPIQKITPILYNYYSYYATEEHFFLE